MDFHWPCSSSRRAFQCLPQHWRATEAGLTDSGVEFLMVGAAAESDCTKTSIMEAAKTCTSAPSIGSTSSMAHLLRHGCHSVSATSNSWGSPLTSYGARVRQETYLGLIDARTCLSVFNCYFRLVDAQVWAPWSRKSHSCGILQQVKDRPLSAKKPNIRRRLLQNPGEARTLNSLQCTYRITANMCG